MTKKRMQMNPMFLALLVVASLLVALFLFKGRGVSQPSHLTGHHPDSVYVVSLSEVTKIDSRFKLRVAVPPFTNINPEEIFLINNKGVKIKLKLNKTSIPYACNDSEDETKDHLGFETGWYKGKLDDYSLSDMEVFLRMGDNETSQVTLPLSHICTRFSSDFGITGTDANFAIPGE